MRLKLIIIFLITICHQSFSQIRVSGKITDKLQNALPDANLSFKKGSNVQTAVTNQDGIFNVVLSETGDYVLEITSMGFDTYSQSLQLLENKSYDLGILNLTELIHQLQSVEVIGRASRNYTSDYSFSATKIAIKNKDLPQSLSTVTKELIADRHAFLLADAVKISSGVIPNSYYNQFAIRGISQNEEGTIVNGMRTHQHYFNQPLTTNIERIEVVKGPASATFSSVDPGGSINLVTKKPLSEARREVSFSVGSFSTVRGSIDFTGPINNKKSLLYRVNGAYHEGKGFRDLQGQRAVLISPSFSYVPNAKTAVNAELVYSSTDGKIDRGQPIFGALPGKTDLKSTPTSFAINGVNDYFKSKELILMGNIAHRFSDHITFNTSYMKQTWTEDLLEHRTTNRFAVDVNNQNIQTLAAMQVVERRQFWNTDNLNAYFNFDIDLGETKSKLLIGYDLNSLHKVKGGGQSAARGYMLKDGTVATSYNLANRENYQTITVDGVEMPKPNVAHFDLANPAFTLKNTNDYVFATRTALPVALTTTNSIYAQEYFSWNKVSLLLGLRYDWYKDITNYETNNEIEVKKEKLLPRIGITYALNKNVNVYSTYLEGYQPHANTVNLMPVAAPTGSTFDPLKSDLKEIGVKSDLLNNKIHITAALYEINQKNILMNANDPENPDLLITRGAERSRGFEVDLAGYILANWQVNASYSYIDAIILKDQNSDLNGARKQNTPINSGNIWTRYNFDDKSIITGLGIGLGMQYSGDMVPWFVRDFKTPSFTVFDAALYYSPNKSDLQIALNVNNVFDKTYWMGAQNYLRLFPGAPRNAMLTATYKF